MNDELIFTWVNPKLVAGILSALVGISIAIISNKLLRKSVLRTDLLERLLQFRLSLIQMMRERKSRWTIEDGKYLLDIKAAALEFNEVDKKYRLEFEMLIDKDLRKKISKFRKPVIDYESLILSNESSNSKMELPSIYEDEELLKSLFQYLENVIEVLETQINRIK